MAIGTAIRMAGPKLFGFLTKGIPKQQLAFRLGMDALGGGMNALYAPGDLGDKLLVAGSDAVFSALGGLALGRIGSPSWRAGFGGAATDFVGSGLGFEAGRRASDQLLRTKDSLMGGPGQTPFEKMSIAQRQQMEAEIRQQVLNQYGLLPGIRPEYYGQESYLTQLGLA